MHFPPKHAAPREDLRLLQGRFDTQALADQRAREAAEALRDEPPLLIFFALLVFLFGVLIFGLAALPSIGSGL